MAAPPCGVASSSVVLTVLLGCSCTLLLAWQHAYAADGWGEVPLQPISNALQLLARRTPVEAWQPRFTPVNVTGGRIQPALLQAARRAVNEGGSVMLTITNTPGMLGQTPQFLTSLKAQPDNPSRHLIVVAFDEAAAQLCARHHRPEQCVLDDWNTTRLTIEDPEKLSDFAAWGGPQFRAMMWRKMELVGELLLQGYSVLCSDTDIALFRNPLDPQVNPFMRADVDLWTSVDGTKGMANCGFFWIQASPRGLAFMEAWLGEAYNASSLMDVWEQMSFATLVWQKPPLISLALLDERYFGELCFYIDAHDALLRNGAALLDAHAFGEAFDATLEAMDAWKTMIGWHFPCCIDQAGGRLQRTPKGDAECKAIATGMAHLRWQAHEMPWTGRAAVAARQSPSERDAATGQLGIAESSQLLPASGPKTIDELTKEYHNTARRYLKLRGTLLPKAAPDYFQYFPGEEPASKGQDADKAGASKDADNSTSRAMHVDDSRGGQKADVKERVFGAGEDESSSTASDSTKRTEADDKARRATQGGAPRKAPETAE